ncbi:uncharacterized protein CLUP02_06494 [Colletotrichum lupini]|uniref:Uncharacterized protein n=1 Tax=Colletotrichum lupini TaxID=145971 RepID=A0A9Q8WEQ0_9PEZI|nr:uncharacterized protein CLUP02_06494 [Colletotrichum lupini]UQC81008.1 hypothetical protein CLUP02_06494 [Colletotrichum lupini]
MAAKRNGERQRYSFCGSRHYGYGAAVAPISAISDTGTSDVGSMERTCLPLADESPRPSAIGRAKLSSNENTAASLGALPVQVYASQVSGCCRDLT